MKSSRVLRPHQGWQTLDFVLAALALICLAYAGGGAFGAMAAWNDLSTLDRVCAEDKCTHHGVVVSNERSLSSLSSWNVGLCVVTIEVDGTQRTAGVTYDMCNQVAVGAAVDVVLWRGKVVRIRTASGMEGTTESPATALLAGIWKLAALIPFAVIVAMIHIDIANHRIVRVIWNRRRAPS